MGELAKTTTGKTTTAIRAKTTTTGKMEMKEQRGSVNYTQGLSSGQGATDKQKINKMEYCD